MRLIAPTAFKGTMSPLEAARFLASEGLQGRGPGTLRGGRGEWGGRAGAGRSSSLRLVGDRLLPLSDGGDGFLECLQQGLGGAIRHLPASDPFRRVRPVPVLVLPDGTVALECAKILGIAGLDRLDPFEATSLGMGEILAAVGRPPAVWIGLGGSATVDGGRDWPRLDLPPTRVFCDVTTDLRDAARIFGPQKGARSEDIPVLEARLAALGLPTGPRTGAAGGLGAKLLSLGAELLDGAQAMLDVLRFDEACAGCEVVVTGEGRLDASSLEGKLPIVVARRARALGIPVHGRFGCRGEGWEQAAAEFDEVSFLP